MILEQEQQLADDDLDAAHGLSYQAYVHIRHAADALATDLAAAAFERPAVCGADQPGVRPVNLWTVSVDMRPTICG